MSIEEDVVTQVGPATKRGQYLLSADLLNLLSGPWTPFRQEQFGLTILAIEQEAAALERRRTVERIRERIDAEDDGSSKGAYNAGIAIHSILDALASESEPQ